MHATDKYLARFTHIAAERRRTYAAKLAAMDDGIRARHDDAARTQARRRHARGLLQ
jgi:hypothetical protein